MVTTNDSRIRFINISNGRNIMKIKGNKNESFHLRASLSPDQNNVICGSENGEIYLWTQIHSNLEALSQQQSTMQIISQRMLHANNKKNKSKSNYYECFTAFDKSTPVSAAIFAPTQVIRQYQKLTKKVWQNYNVYQQSQMNDPHQVKP